MDKHCDYWIDCDKPATVKIHYKIKGCFSTACHVNYLCDECGKDIHDNLPTKAFDFSEEPL